MHQQISHTRWISHDFKQRSLSVSSTESDIYFLSLSGIEVRSSVVGLHLRRRLFFLANILDSLLVVSSLIIDFLQYLPYV